MNRTIRTILIAVALAVTIATTAGNVTSQTVDLPPVYLSQDHLALIYRSGVTSATADSFARSRGLRLYEPTADQYIPTPLNMRVYTLDRSILPPYLTVEEMAHRLRMRWPHIIYMAEPLSHEFSVPSPDELMVRFDADTPWERVHGALVDAGLRVERRGEGFALCVVDRDRVGSLVTATTIADRIRGEAGSIINYAEPNTYRYATPLVDMPGAVHPSDEVLRILPSPFNPNTAIHYEVAASGEVSLVIYNALGQRVRTLITGDRPSGVHRITWDGLDDSGSRVSSGVYVVRLKTVQDAAVKRVTVIY